MLDIFTNMPPERLRRLGNVAYGRVFYALRFLFQLGHQIWATSTYDLIKIDSLRLQLYIDALAGCLRRASADGKFKVAGIWLYALESRVIPWYEAFCDKLAEDHVESDKPPQPTPPPSQADLRPTPAGIMLPALQPPATNGAPRSMPMSPVTTQQIPNGTYDAIDAAGPAPPLASEAMALFNDQFFSPVFHENQVPLDTFDPDAFDPSQLSGLSQYAQPGQFGEDAMDVDSYGVDFGAMYELISNSVSASWNVHCDPENAPQGPPR